MTKKFWIIIVLVLLLTGSAIFQINYAHTTISTLDKRLQSLQLGLQTEQKTENIDELIEYWNHRESVLCIMFNHNDMKDVGKELTNIKGYLDQDDFKEAEVHCQLALVQVETLTHLIEFTIQNIF